MPYSVAAVIGSLLLVIRRARLDDLVTLLELEKAASTVALAHVFGPDIPFPDDDVLARWRIVLDALDVTVLIDEEGAEPVGYAAYGDGWLRHFGYIPEWWGTGRAQELHAAVMDGLLAEGISPLRLWVLVENRRARAFYTRLGWYDSGVREQEVFAPYPQKMEMLYAAL
jgi:RimJ/RimL family protein N-acetyltransferase